MPELPLVTVVIPMYREPRLKGCLCALLSQSYPMDRTEIVVVDREGRLDPRYETWMRGVKQARLVREMVRDNYAARNLGAAGARGEILAFTDPDCLPERDWLERGVEALRAGAGPVSGRVALFHPARRTAAGLYDELFLNAESSNPTSSTLFVYREDFLKIGPFQEQSADAMSEWSARAAAAGKPVRTLPEGAVRRPALARAWELLRKVRRSLATQPAARPGGWREAGALACRDLLSSWNLLRQARHAAHMRSVGLRVRFSALVALVQATRALERFRLLGNDPARP